jgi:hypothetical protein
MLRNEVKGLILVKFLELGSGNATLGALLGGCFALMHITAHGAYKFLFHCNVVILMIIVELSIVSIMQRYTLKMTDAISISKKFLRNKPWLNPCGERRVVEINVNSKE